MQPPRTIGVITYLTFSIAGVFFLFWGPSVGLRTLLGDTGYVIWNWFLIAGGIFGIIGAGYKKFRIEIIAVPFLTTGLIVYGISLLARLNTSPSPGVLAGLASIFFGAALGIFGQGLAIWLNKIRVARDIDRRSHG